MSIATNDLQFRFELTPRSDRGTAQRKQEDFMSTAYRTRESMSFRQHWNGNPCAFALIGDVDAVTRRPAVDPSSSGDSVT